MRCYLRLEGNCELNYTPFVVFGGICPNLMKLFNQVHYFIDLIYQQNLKF